MGLGSTRTSISPLSFFLGFAVAFLLLGIHSSGIVDVDYIPGVASFKANNGAAAGQSTVPHADPRDLLRASWAHIRSPGFDTEDKAPRLDKDIPPEKVCVMSSDTRKMNPLGARPPNFDLFALEPYVYSVYYNLWWALRHGYKYQMVRAKPFPCRFGFPVADVATSGYRVLIQFTVVGPHPSNTRLRPDVDQTARNPAGAERPIVRARRVSRRRCL